MDWKPAILLHANYYEQGQTLEEAIIKAKAIGADGFEFRRQTSRWKGSEEGYLDEISRLLDRYPMEWVSFGAPGVDLMGGDPSKRADELKAAEKFYRLATKRFPLKIVNTFVGRLQNPDKSISFLECWRHGSAIATEEQWNNAIEGFRIMGELAGELGFRFAFETHGVYLHDTVPSAMKLVEAIDSPHVGVLWDQVNMMFFKEKIGMSEAIKILKDKLFYVHLKNMLFPSFEIYVGAKLSEGMVNIREQLKLLYDSGYRGPLCIESPGEGDREHFAKQDIVYLRSLIREMDEPIRSEKESHKSNSSPVCYAEELNLYEEKD